jgi:hypothetical protein
MSGFILSKYDIVSLKTISTGPSASAPTGEEKNPPPVEPPVCRSNRSVPVSATVGVWYKITLSVSPLVELRLALVCVQSVPSAVMSVVWVSYNLSLAGLVALTSNDP